MDNDIATQRIFHIAEPERWTSSADDGWYAPASLADDGFIHCSFARQVQRSLDKFFTAHDSVIVLEIDPLMLKNEVKVEPADGDGFPHIYGEINVDAVVVAELLTRDDDGSLTFTGRKE